MGVEFLVTVLVIFLILVLVIWVLNAFLPIDTKIKQLLSVVIIVIFLVWLLLALV